MEYVFLAPLISLTANIISNFGILKFSKTTGVVLSLAWSTALGLVVLLLTHGVLQDLDYLIPNGVIYLALSYCFFHFVHIPVASVRIRVLLELAARPKVAEAELLKTYGASQILEFRVKRLTDTNQIEDVNGTFKTKEKKIYYVAALLAHLKRFVRRGEVST